jgi:hypothetical protein
MLNFKCSKQTEFNLIGGTFIIQNIFNIFENVDAFFGFVLLLTGKSA